MSVTVKVTWDALLAVLDSIGQPCMHHAELPAGTEIRLPDRVVELTEGSHVCHACTEELIRKGICCLCSGYIESKDRIPTNHGHRHPGCNVFGD